MMPLLSDQVSAMDEARMAFVNALNDHVLKLREELRVSELILHSVIKSLSTKTDDMQQLDLQLNDVRKQSVDHRPYVVNKHDDAIEQVENVLKYATQQINKRE